MAEWSLTILLRKESTIEVLNSDRKGYGQGPV